MLKPQGAKKQRRCPSALARGLCLFRCLRCSALFSLHLLAAGLRLHCCTRACRLPQAGPPCFSARAPRCGDLSCCGAQALGTGASAVAVRRLSCSEACGILPDQGLNTGRQILICYTTGEVLLISFFIK